MEKGAADSRIDREGQLYSGHPSIDYAVVAALWLAANILMGTWTWADPFKRLADAEEGGAFLYAYYGTISRVAANVLALGLTAAAIVVSFASRSTEPAMLEAARPWVRRNFHHCIRDFGIILGYTLVVSLLEPFGGRWSAFARSSLACILILGMVRLYRLLFVFRAVLFPKDASASSETWAVESAANANEEGAANLSPGPDERA